MKNTKTDPTRPVFETLMAHHILTKPCSNLQGFCMQLGVVKKALTDLSNSVEIFWVATSRNKKGGELSRE